MSAGRENQDTGAACEQARRLGAYHDGELDPGARRAVEAHLADCDVCRRELAQLQGLSRLLSGAARPALPPDGLGRLHRRVDGAREGAFVHLIEGLTAAVAAVLLLCAGWLWQAGAAWETPAAPTAWEMTAVTLRVDSSAGASGQFAQWLVEDLTRENGHD